MLQAMSLDVSNMILKQSEKAWNGSHKINRKTKKTRKVPSKNETIHITLFDNKGIIHKEYVPTGQALTDQYHLAILKRLMTIINRIHPENLTDNS
ncbi:hypothetical protein TNCV_4577661 [Trichonephila clavipes]|nr:hypothetical protein TNCV_4577661 [Trichonephila clavipes]